MPVTSQPEVREVREILGRYLRHVRTERGLRQRELAARAEMDSGKESAAEAGNVGDITYVKLAAALDYPYTEFVADAMEWWRTQVDSGSPNPG